MVPQSWKLIIEMLQDLCDAALSFAFDTLRVGGHFVCKFYQGSEDKALELRLKALFAKVHREKPESSRSVSLERIPWSITRVTVSPGIERGVFCCIASKGRCSEGSCVSGYVKPFMK